MENDSDIIFQTQSKSEDGMIQQFTYQKKTRNYIPTEFEKLYDWDVFKHKSTNAFIAIRCCLMVDGTYYLAACIYYKDRQLHTKKDSLRVINEFLKAGIIPSMHNMLNKGDDIDGIGVIIDLDPPEWMLKDLWLNNLTNNYHKLFKVD